LINYPQKETNATGGIFGKNNTQADKENIFTTAATTPRKAAGNCHFIGFRPDGNKTNFYRRTQQRKIVVHLQA
jgi:hypothetical protein